MDATCVLCRKRADRATFREADFSGVERVSQNIVLDRLAVPAIWTITMNRQEDDTHRPQPSIVENYKDFEPPPNFRTLVEDLLAAVPPKYLIGLRMILLTNESSLTRNQRRQKTRGRKHKVRVADTLGTYHQATNSSGAAVWLNVDNIVESWGRRMFKMPGLRYFPVADVLYHEIGHHIHKVHKPVHDGRENIAEDWSSRLSARFYWRRYWYARPLMYCASLIIKALKRMIPAVRRITR